MKQLAFTAKPESRPPLAERMRPRTLETFVGQGHLLGPGAPLRVALEKGTLGSTILYGPPGTGKTTLARLMARKTRAEFVPFSAVLGGVKALREIVSAARERLRRSGRATLLFVDEIHRFNKAQQDAFLPHVESGLLILIGATTENPSFELNAALLSRATVYTLRRLDERDLLVVLRRAMNDEENGIEPLPFEPEALSALARHADGDARRALNALEHLAAVWAGIPEPPATLSLSWMKHALGDRRLRYDRASEEHYNIASAFIKSMRASDPDASVYWLVRMIEGGEDPRFIARRLVIFASEDVGNADPRVLSVALGAAQAVDLVGLPECRYALVQAALYCALAPKSNLAASAWQAALKDVRERGSLPVPMHIRNAPTKWMKAEGYGAGYLYPHDFEDHYCGQACLPESLRGRRYVDGPTQGLEARLIERLNQLRERRSDPSHARSARTPRGEDRPLAKDEAKEP